MPGKFENLDGEGNKLMEKTNLGTKNYGYDNIYELTSAAYEKGQSFTWSYDSAGNRAFSRDSIPMLSEKTYNVNNLNQYSSVNGTSWSYDADGNLLSDGTKTYGWDIKNRLTQVVNSGITINYVYDHNDLRVEKTKSGTTTRYYYDGSLLLAEKINGQVQKEYINDGQGITGMVNPIYTNGTINHYQRLYYLYDSLGSVSVITGDNGLPLQRYTYSPYGACLNVHNDPINSLQFIGKYGGYLDSDTGLTYFWHRWYDTSNGRWISRDPINVKGGINLYGYVDSVGKGVYDSKHLALYSYAALNPVRYVDPDGNQSMEFLNYLDTDATLNRAAGIQPQSPEDEEAIRQYRTAAGIVLDVATIPIAFSKINDLVKAGKYAETLLPLATVGLASWGIDISKRKLKGQDVNPVEEFIQSSLSFIFGLKEVKNPIEAANVAKSGAEAVNTAPAAAETIKQQSQEEECK